MVFCQSIKQIERSVSLILVILVILGKLVTLGIRLLLYISLL